MSKTTDGLKKGSAFETCASYFPKLKYILAAAIFAAMLFTVGYEHFSGHETAPDVTFTTITGKKMALTSLRGRPVIVTFWATDCPACIREIPHWIELYRRYHDLGLELIAVAMAYDPPSHVVGMTRARQLPYDVALDWSASHARAFGDVSLTPATFLISPEGKIIERHIGLIDSVKMKNLIERLLKG